MAKKEWSTDELRSKAAAYCAVAEHCLSEVEDKLRTWGATAAQVETVLPWLEAENYIAESRYAKAFVHDKLLYQGWGRVKIRTMLQAKRISSADISAALATIDEDEYSRILHHLIEKKMPAETVAVYRFLLQRGFTYDEIRQVLPDYENQ